MQLEWFYSVVDSWGLGLASGDPLRDQLANKVRRVAELNGGRAYADVPMSESEQRDHAMLRATEALQRRSGYYASRLRSLHTAREFYWSQVDGDGPEFGVLAALRDRTDINSAPLSDLIALPNIGPVTAQRIIDRRENVGPFATVDELSEIRGLSSRDVDEIDHMICALPFPHESAFQNAALSTFAQKPTFAAYVDLMRSTGGYFRHASMAPEGADLIARILSELDHLAAELAAAPFPDFANQRVTSASRALRDQDLLHQHREISQRRVGGDYGGLLFDSNYHHTVRELIDSASQSVRLSMFFFRFEDAASYPTDELMAALVDAKARGVSDIKVVLDQEEGQPESTTINEEAMTFLISNGIDAKFDHLDTLNHIKLLIIDGKFVVIGSHNWTAGSFYVYDDTSIFLQSPPLAASMTRAFDAAFDQL
jgi:hypothetical protein